MLFRSSFTLAAPSGAWCFYTKAGRRPALPLQDIKPSPKLVITHIYFSVNYLTVMLLFLPDNNRKKHKPGFWFPIIRGQNRVSVVLMLDNRYCGALFLLTFNIVQQPDELVEVGNDGVGGHLGAGAVKCQHQHQC